jgi:hypothetical protein
MKKAEEPSYPKAFLEEAKAIANTNVGIFLKLSLVILL